MIHHPNMCKCEACTSARLAEDKVSEVLRVAYNTNSEVKRLAEKIHKHGMIPPPACDRCIQIAMNQLGLSYETT